MTLRYPTGDKLLDDLTEFCAARLPTLHTPRQPKVPCLSEDWWVEERLAEGRVFPMPKLSPEEGLRWCWRFARDRNPFGGGDERPDTLLHQMTEMLPMLFAAAGEAFRGQNHETR